MQVEAMLADSVVVAEGKLYLQGGGWNALTTPGPFPIRHDRIGLGVIIRVPYNATNEEHSFSVALRTQDGESVPLGDAPPGIDSPDGKIRELEGRFNVGRPPTISPGDEQVVPIAANLNNISFEKPDLYSFKISIDGTEVKNLPFRVGLIPGVVASG